MDGCRDRIEVFAPLCEWFLQKAEGQAWQDVHELFHQLELQDIRQLTCFNETYETIRVKRGGMSPLHLKESLAQSRYRKSWVNGARVTCSLMCMYVSSEILIRGPRHALHFVPFPAFPLMPSPQPRSRARDEYRGFDHKNERIVHRMAFRQATSGYLRKESCSPGEYLWRVRCLGIGSHVIPFLQISIGYRKG